MADALPAAIADYFEADRRRDVEGVVALFTADATVVDEGITWHGSDEIRAWRIGPASKYQYTTELFEARSRDGGFAVSGRLKGDFPGGAADLTWRFTLRGNRITGLEIE